MRAGLADAQAIGTGYAQKLWISFRIFREFGAVYPPLFLLLKDFEKAQIRVDASYMHSYNDSYIYR